MSCIKIGFRLHCMLSVLHNGLGDEHHGLIGLSWTGHLLGLINSYQIETSSLLFKDFSSFVIGSGIFSVVAEQLGCKLVSDFLFTKRFLA